MSFSEQNLVDCVKTCSGCEGGLMDKAFDYIKKNGIVAEKDYPYRGIDEFCRKNSSSIVYKIRSFKRIETNSEDALKEAVATVGPISVAIDATIILQLYSSG